jgi:hypothetical protein
MKLKSQLYATQTGLPIWTLLRANKKTKRKAKKGIRTARQETLTVGTMQIRHCFQKKRKRRLTMVHEKCLYLMIRLLSK